MHRFAPLMVLIPPAILGALATATPQTGETPPVEEFVTVQKGTLPIIISAPHGGRKQLPNVPERVNKTIPNFETARDENTAELVAKLLIELEKALNGKPWAVIAQFERKYLDVNRPPETAYESVKAKPYYDAYHAALADACQSVKKTFGHGLLLDIHGQAVYPDAICRGTLNLKTVSLLKDRHGMAAIRGRNSVFGRLERLGYTVMPATTEADNAKEVPKFAGGHIVATYGSHTASTIDAIQVELGSTFRTRDRYPRTAADLATAIKCFYEDYLQDSK